MCNLITALFIVLSPKVVFAVVERVIMKAGTEITVDHYSSDSDSFEITINKERGVGPNVATSEALQKAIGTEGAAKDFQRRLIHDVGSIYVLKKELPLLFEKEIKERKKKFQKKLPTQSEH
jgi:hypothetical protein